MLIRTNEDVFRADYTPRRGIVIDAHPRRASKPHRPRGIRRDDVVADEGGGADATSHGEVFPG